ncbi:MAG: hypothetical protein HQL06_16125 [Nitrospirae bacterium]|nr:hypothetical protein [Nitrospirota bacterium]
MEDYFIHNNFFYIVAYIVVSLIFMAMEDRIGFPSATAAALLYYLVYSARQDDIIRGEMTVGGWAEVTWTHRIKYNRCSSTYAWFWPMWIAMILALSLVVLVVNMMLPKRRVNKR